MADKVKILRIEVDQETARKALQTTEQRLIRLREEQTKYRKEVRQSNGTNKEAVAQLAKVQAAIKTNSDRRRRLTKDINTESGSLQALRNQLSKLVALRNKINTSTAEGSKRFNELNAKILQYNNSIKKAEAAGGDFRRNVGNYPKLFSQITTSLVGMIGGFYAFIRVITSAAKTVKEFDEAQAGLASILGVSRDQMQGLTEDSLAYGKSTTFTASQVTQLQTELAKLGFTQREIRDSTGAVLSLAEATGAQLGDAARVSGAALRAFGLDAVEAGRVTSVLAVATTKTALSFNDYETALSTVAPVARAYGFMIEETVALLGKLRDAGFDASSAATATRNIILNLADSNGKLAQSLGGSVESFDDLIPALVNLRERGVSLNETLQLTDKRSVAAFNQFLNGAESAGELADNLVGVNDELQQMVETKLDTIAGDTKRLSSAWEGFILSIDQGNGLIAKATRAILQFTTAVLQVATDDNLNFFEKLGTVLNPFALTAYTAAKATEAFVNEQEKLNYQVRVNAEVTEAFNGNIDENIASLKRAVQAFGENTEAGRFYMDVLTEIDRLQQQTADSEKERINELQRIKEEAFQADQERMRKEREAELEESYRRTQDMIDQLEREIEYSETFIGIERENSDEFLKIRRETLNKRQQLAKINAAAEIAIEQAVSDAKIELMTTVIGVAGDLAKQGTAQYKILKSAEAVISAYTAINKTLADPKLVFPLDVITAAIIGAQALGNVAKINNVGFAEGGKVGDRGVHLSPDNRGDNRLIIARDNEVILNSQQQSKIGARNLKSAGVPGFADGGLVGTVSQPIIQEAENTNNIINSFSNLPPIYVGVRDINQGQARVRVKDKVSKI